MPRQMSSVSPLLLSVDGYNCVEGIVASAWQQMESAVGELYGYRSLQADVSLYVQEEKTRRRI